MTSGYRARHELPAASTVQAALEALTDRELVGRQARGNYLIAEPFLAEWIRALDDDPAVRG